MVYALALLAALLFGVGAVVQQHAAAQAPPALTLTFRLLLWLVRRPLWLVGVATAVVGNLASAAALGLGGVALVQPLLASRLLFALPLAAAWMHRRVPGRDWVAAVCVAGGLAAFVLAGRPARSLVGGGDLPRWGVLAAVVAALAGGLVMLSRRLDPGRQAAALGAAAGMLFGVQAGLTQVTIESLSAAAPWRILLQPTSYAVAGVAVLGTLLAQSAYELAPLQASFPAIAAVEPLAGIGVGVGVLGGTLRLGVEALAVAVVGLVVMTAGIALLARSPLVTRQEDLLLARQELGQAARGEDELRHDLDRLRQELPRRPAAVVRCQLAALDGELCELVRLHGEAVHHEQLALAREEADPTQRAALVAAQREVGEVLQALQAEVAALHRTLDRPACAS